MRITKKKAAEAASVPTLLLLLLFVVLVIVVKNPKIGLRFLYSLCHTYVKELLKIRAK